MSDFTTEAFTLLGVAIGVIFLRTYARVKAVGIKHLQADDYLMLFVAVTYSAETALAYSVGAFWRGLANNGMTDEERRNLDPNSEEFMLRVNGSKTQIAGWITYSCLVLWPAKAAMCTFYVRLTPAISKINILVTVVLNVITDLYLLSIPIPMLWGAQLPLRKKLGLIVLFSGGIFVTMAGILRCVLIIANPVTGAQQAGSWAVRETFVAIVTTNIPMIFPLVRRWLTPIFGSITSTLSRGTNNRYGNSKRSDLPAPGSIKLDDVTNGSSSGNKKKGRQPFSQYPITEFTLSGSEEHLNKSPPLPGGISKNVEVRVEESKRDVGSSGTGSMESSMERGDSYFTVDVNGVGGRTRKATRSKSYRGSMKTAFGGGEDKKEGGYT
ncbi:short-chain dehydrogenase reductase sdr [Colletotrichum tofieldiae]|nr:short-chain dehydrogenase reductase sdr [Colletotrichum tofieldiae]GKT73940.1 short-chain dehydrogenase reductase sdr [Colletotrichum tofieldiae]